MSGVNKVILVGRLGKDPETRTLENGNKVSAFSLATSESYFDKPSGEKKEVTEWHNIVLWGKVAEIAEKYLSKGSMIYVEGKLKKRSWEKDGITRYTTEVNGSIIQMLGKNETQSSTSTPKQSNQIESNDLPF